MNYTIPEVPPDGYEYTGELREPAYGVGEKFLSNEGEVMEKGEPFTTFGLRAILRPVPKPKRKRMVFDVLAENARPKKGQLFKDDAKSNEVELATFDFQSPREFILSAPRIEEVE